MTTLVDLERERIRRDLSASFDDAPEEFEIDHTQLVMRATKLEMAAQEFDVAALRSLHSEIGEILERLAALPCPTGC